MIEGLFTLPRDVLLEPIESLPETALAQFEHMPGDFALTRPQSLAQPRKGQLRHRQCRGATPKGGSGALARNRTAPHGWQSVRVGLTPFAVGLALGLLETIAELAADGKFTDSKFTLLGPGGALA